MSMTFPKYLWKTLRGRAASMTARLMAAVKFSRSSLKIPTAGVLSSPEAPPVGQEYSHERKIAELTLYLGWGHVWRLGLASRFRLLACS
jgi:hypothetical protein